MHTVRPGPSCHVGRPSHHPKPKPHGAHHIAAATVTRPRSQAGRMYNVARDGVQDALNPAVTAAGELLPEGMAAKVGSGG